MLLFVMFIVVVLFVSWFRLVPTIIPMMINLYHNTFYILLNIYLHADTKISDMISVKRFKMIL
ncbi:hypothetical protein AW729_10885 [Methanosphaera sp. BMS]|nr:hypothetical protein AW729_10885 [Methanosphaera sp. BMS]